MSICSLFINLCEGVIIFKILFCSLIKGLTCLLRAFPHTSTQKIRYSHVEIMDVVITLTPNFNDDLLKSILSN